MTDLKSLPPPTGSVGEEGMEKLRVIDSLVQDLDGFLKVVKPWFLVLVHVV